jgi:acyl carrier protein
MTVLEKIQRFVGEELQAPEEALDPEFPLIANHVVDSLGLLQLVSFLEEEFEVEVEDEELVPDNFGSISLLVRLVESKRSEVVG